MMGRKSGKSRQRMSRKAKIAMYSTFTVLLTSLVVTGYYLVSSGIIFGKFDVKDDTYKLGKVLTYGNPTQDADTGEEIAIDPNKIVVTNQNQEGAVPLTSDNKDLPEIPPCVGEKHSETNPFVILEVVPQLSQQSLSYLVGSPEKGMPFDPVDVSIRFYKEYNINGGKGYLKDNKKDLIDRSPTVTNALQNCGYIYFTNLFGTMNKADGTDLNYYDVDFLYDFSMYSSEIPEADFESKSVKQLFDAYPEVFALAAPDLFVVEKDGKGAVTKVTPKNSSIEKAINDEQNWSKQKNENSGKAKASYSFVISAAQMEASDFSKPMEQLAQIYPDLFSVDKNGKKPAAADLKNNKGWKREKTQEVTRFGSGYLVKVPAGTGKYEVSGYNPWTNDKHLYLKESANGRWNYVENLDNPDPMMEVQKFYGNRQHEIDGSLRQPGDEGVYISLNYIYHDENPYYQWAEGCYADFSNEVYTFDYAKYEYTLKYAGLRFNDILRHGLFERDTEEEYEQLNVQVIVVTPDMINEMDANDTPETISYIERADCFYISQYYDGYNDGNSSVAENFYQFANFYNEYCGGDDRTLSQGEHKDLISYDDTDLEWFDCMKILKRLSSNAKLPLMWTKLVGGMWQEGLDGNYNSQIYIDPNNTSVDLKSSMNNLAKLYGITIQFDLQATKSDEEKNLSPTDPDYRRTFMDDIYPELQVMKLNKDQMGSGSKHPAQYTGYWERTPLATGGSHKDDEEYLKRCYYLWDKFTFLPTDITGVYGQNGGAGYDLLVTKYGYLATYLNNSTYSQDSADRNSFQNAYDSRGSAAMSGTDGSDEEADAIGAQNVTVAGSEHTDNQNQSIPRSRSELDRMIDILKKIMGDRGTAPKYPDKLDFNLLKFPKYYIRMSNETILLDFSDDAKYKANKKIYVKFTLTNTNNEDAIIQKVSLVSDGASTKPLEIYEDDTGNSSSKRALENVKYSNDTASLKGYRIPAHNSLECYVPVNLKDWQDGKSGQKIKVEWMSRMNYVKSDKTLYSQKAGDNEVFINERELFMLE